MKLLFLPNLLLQRHSQHLTVQRQELVDSKLLNICWCGEELVIGIGLLLRGQLIKLIEKLLLLFWNELV